MAHPTNTHIAQLHKSLEAAEAHIRLLKNARNITRDKEVLLEQLARAYGQLQSIYATYSNPAKYSFSFGEVKAWVNSVENAVGNDKSQGRFGSELSGGWCEICYQGS
ncbi:hypothetical protein Slin14017_G123200 [Septoria linicola]|nr:hypothetical protein Slin14017_G123200 [Septoria linicola]